MTEEIKEIEKEAIVTVTPSAIVEVKRLLELEKEDNMYLRLGVDAGGCSGMSYSMTFDTNKTEFDREFVFDGITVLVDFKALRPLAGTILDYQGGLLGGGFQFKNPNAKRSCGCGSSFSC